MRARIPIAAALLLATAALLFGCGSSGGATTGTGNAEGTNGAGNAGAGNGGGSKASPGSGAAGSGAAGQSGGPTGVRARTCEAEHVEALRVTGTDCATANRVSAAWVAEASCHPAAEASRSACSVDGFRCLSAVTGRGVPAFCVQPGRAIAFIAKAE